MSMLASRLTRRSHTARAAAALAGALVMVAVLASSVASAGPRRLATQVTDDVGALGGTSSAVQQALDDLQRGNNVQLWVWFTDTTGSLSAPAFATQTAALSGFGGNDLLLVLAMSDHAYGYWKSNAIRLSNAQLDMVLGTDLEPSLQAGDNGGAIVAAAAGIRGAMGGAGAGSSTAPAAGGSTRDTGGGGGGGSPLGTLLTVLLMVGLISVAGWWFLYRRKRPVGTGAGDAGTAGAPADDIAAMTTPDLEKLANQALVTTDDAVRDSEQELGFAQAQFGDAEVAPFQAAIAGAKSDLAAAFKLRQQLDDAVPEDAATHRRMLEELVRGCRHAQDQLDAVKEEFERLREIEAKAPQILAALPAQADALEARIPAAQQAMTRLGMFADASWQSVAPNIDEARQRLAAVREAVDEGAKALAASDTQTAARAARLGQDALGQGTAFLDGVDRLAKELDEAKAKVDQMLVDADVDLAQAKKAAAGSADPALTARLAQADTLLTGARTALAGPKPDVAAAYQQARDAHTIADDVLATLRTAAEQLARDAARLDASIKAAQATLTRATDFIATRRGAVGTEARTRLAEAQRHLDQAIAAGAADPVGGTREADEATRLANAAYQAAADDYGRYDDPWHGGRRGGGGSGVGGDIAGALIGGIIGGMLSGGGRGGGFGGFGGGGFGGGWGGGSSGGGGWGGGGGSSGGGRW
jgi:BMFP domain-containing protein YqiC